MKKYIVAVFYFMVSFAAEKETLKLFRSKDQEVFITQLMNEEQIARLINVIDSQKTAIGTKKTLENLMKDLSSLCKDFYSRPTPNFDRTRIPFMEPSERFDAFRTNLDYRHFLNNLYNLLSKCYTKKLFDYNDAHWFIFKHDIRIYVPNSDGPSHDRPVSRDIQTASPVRDCFGYIFLPTEEWQKYTVLGPGFMSNLKKSSIESLPRTAVKSDLEERISASLRYGWNSILPIMNRLGRWVGNMD